MTGFITKAKGRINIKLALKTRTILVKRNKISKANM
jgi:hypothetical protein